MTDKDFYEGNCSIVFAVTHTYQAFAMSLKEKIEWEVLHGRWLGAIPREIRVSYLTRRLQDSDVEARLRFQISAPRLEEHQFRSFRMFTDVVVRGLIEQEIPNVQLIEKQVSFLEPRTVHECSAAETA